MSSQTDTNAPGFGFGGESRYISEVTEPIRIYSVSDDKLETIRIAARAGSDYLAGTAFFGALVFSAVLSYIGSDRAPMQLACKVAAFAFMPATGFLFWRWLAERNTVDRIISDMRSRFDKAVQSGNVRHSPY